MMKLMTCLIGCFLIALSLKAQDTTTPAADTARQAADSVKQPSDTAQIMTALKDSGVVRSTAPAGDTTSPAGNSANSGDSVISPAGGSTSPKPQNTVAVSDSSKTAAVSDTPKTSDTPPAGQSTDTPKPDAPKDTTAGQSAEPAARQFDTRWFISPLLKLQFQDFAMLEKNREGYLSNANTLPFFSRGNASFAASAYKNITGRLSVSADLGLSFGHVTSDQVEISQTKSQTFNLLNATVYYHLLPASYRLQPFVEAGINDIINSASYLTIPMGIGAKFNSQKVMALAEVSYGEAVGKNIANTTMYSLGVYIPIGGKKHKQLDNDDATPYDKSAKNDKKKDTTKPNGTVINNIYVTINMDSVLKAKGLLNDDGSARRDDGRDGDDDADGSSGHSRRQRRGLRNFDVNDFGDNDYKMDSLDGKPAIRFVVYFEFNDFGLNSSAFEAIDKVIGHLRRTPNQFMVEIKGYTDSVGNDHYNNWLSRERAKMVLKYMNSRGVPADLMQAKAYGKDNPVADNSDPSKAWLNRRAEIIVHAKESLANGK